MASIRKLSSGNHQVQIRRKGLPAVARTFSKKKDADAFARQVDGDTELCRKLGKHPINSPTFSTVVDMYMDQYSGKDPSTNGRLAWWCDFFSSLNVAQIDAFQVDEGLDKLRQKGLTGSTINRYKSTLSAAFNFFIQHPDYKRTKFNNPLREQSVSRFPENPPKENFLSQEKQYALLKACRSASWERLYLLVLMALTTGARRGELLGLKWTDINLQERTARLKQTKNGKSRYLPLTTSVVKELMKFRQPCASLVFPSTKNPVKPFEFRKCWLKAIAAAKIEQCRFHDLRHTSASNLVQAGRTLFEVGTLLGHSSTQMTARYSHLAINHTQDMVDTVMGNLK